MNATSRFWSAAALCVLALGSCSSGGGGAPADPNPANTPPSASAIQMDGAWAVENVQVQPDPVTGYHNAFLVGSVIYISGGSIVAMDLPGGTFDTSLFAIEAELGFTLDWYQNHGDGTRLTFGYGWDRLGTPGGAGPNFHDLVQYGLRIAGYDSNNMTAYEGEVRQSQPGSQRNTWSSYIHLQRIISPSMLEEWIPRTLSGSPAQRGQ